MEIFAIPSFVTGIEVIIIFFTAFIAAALTAALGLGGGILLLAVMSVLLPPFAVVPLHGVAQLGSNGWRSLLQWRHVAWPLIFYFMAGSFVGALLARQFVVELPPAFFQLGVAFFIILTLNSVKFKMPEPGYKSFAFTGVISSFLSMFFGATGPIVASLLSATRLSRFEIMATHGLGMFAQHFFKIVMFGSLGFGFGQWAGLIVMILGSGFFGTLVGTHLLAYLPEAKFKIAFRALLFAMALMLAGNAVYSFWVA